jgi:hypothetical protein
MQFVAAITHWHETIGDPTLADAILDRVVHNAYKINLSGKTMRKEMGNLQPTQQKLNLNTLRRFAPSDLAERSLSRWQNRAGLCGRIP